MVTIEEIRGVRKLVDSIPIFERNYTIKQMFCLNVKNHAISLKIFKYSKKDIIVIEYQSPTQRVFDYYIRSGKK